MIITSMVLRQPPLGAGFEELGFSRKPTRQDPKGKNLFNTLDIDFANEIVGRLDDDGILSITELASDGISFMMIKKFCCEWITRLVMDPNTKVIAAASGCSSVDFYMGWVELVDDINNVSKLVKLFPISVSNTLIEFKSIAVIKINPKESWSINKAPIFGAQS